MKNTFDLAQPQARAIRSASFGGGWIVPLTDVATDALTNYYGEPPAELAPISATGWIVEPHQSPEIHDVLRSANIAWCIA